ncbi:MAG: bacterioferritin-associated ferredoxin [Marinagarivorans sp.]|nr:bacterioferritin-associated ferredoxin [Marinagarivorans sp.]
MYVCICKGITDTQIRNAVDNGANSMRDLRESLGVSSQCGKCASLTKQIARDYQNQIQASQFYPAA